jgi:hypothetical protein
MPGGPRSKTRLTLSGVLGSPRLVDLGQEVIDDERLEDGADTYGIQVRLQILDQLHRGGADRDRAVGIRVSIGSCQPSSGASSAAWQSLPVQVARSARRSCKTAASSRSPGAGVCPSQSANALSSSNGSVR